MFEINLDYQQRRRDEGTYKTSREILRKIERNRKASRMIAVKASINDDSDKNQMHKANDATFDYN